LLELVYVCASGGVPVAEANQIMARRIEHDFEKLLVALDPPPTMQVVSMRRSGNAAEQLSMYADKVKADLIAVGSHRYTFLERMRMGSVSAAVLYHANCSVLVAPPEPI